MEVHVFEFDWGDVVADLSVEPDLVEPPNSIQGGQLEVIDATPGAFVSDALGIAEPD